MTILITDEGDCYQIMYSINGNSCVHQFETFPEVLKDLENLQQIEHNLFKCPGPAPDKLLKTDKLD